MPFGNTGFAALFEMEETNGLSRFPRYDISVRTITTRYGASDT